MKPSLFRLELRSLQECEVLQECDGVGLWGPEFDLPWASRQQLESGVYLFLVGLLVIKFIYARCYVVTCFEVLE